MLPPQSYSPWKVFNSKYICKLYTMSKYSLNHCKNKSIKIAAILLSNTRMASGWYSTCFSKSKSYHTELMPLKGEEVKINTMSVARVNVLQFISAVHWKPLFSNAGIHFESYLISLSQIKCCHHGVIALEMAWRANVYTLLYSSPYYIIQ